MNTFSTFLLNLGYNLNIFLLFFRQFLQSSDSTLRFITYFFVPFAFFSTCSLGFPLFVVVYRLHSLMGQIFSQHLLHKHIPIRRVLWSYPLNSDTNIHTSMYCWSPKLIDLHRLVLLKNVLGVLLPLFLTLLLLSFSLSDLFYCHWYYCFRLPLILFFFLLEYSFFDRPQRKYSSAGLFCNYVILNHSAVCWYLEKSSVTIAC